MGAVISSFGSPSPNNENVGLGTDTLGADSTSSFGATCLGLANADFFTDCCKTLIVGLLVDAVTFLTTGIGFFGPSASCDAPPTPTILSFVALWFDLRLVVDGLFVFEIVDVFNAGSVVLVDEDLREDGMDKLPLADPLTASDLNNDVDDLKGLSKTLIVGVGKAAGVG